MITEGEPMELELLSLRRAPKTKTSFIVHLRIGGKLHHARARLFPKQGNSVEFAEDETLGLLLETGYKARYLVGAIVAAHRGQKLVYPITFQDQAPPKRRHSLTLPARTLLKVG
jgi:hypothetical protein